MSDHGTAAVSGGISGPHGRVCNIKPPSSQKANKKVEELLVFPCQGSPARPAAHLVGIRHNFLREALDALIVGSTEQQDLHAGVGRPQLLHQPHGVVSKAVLLR